MDSKRYIKNLLKDLSLNKITPESAFKDLKDLPYKDLKFARLDYHRLLRKGFGEVVYCAGKTPDHVKKILEDIIDKKGQVFLIFSTFGDIFESQVVPKTKDINPLFQEEIYYPKLLTDYVPASMVLSYNNGLFIARYKARDN